MVYRPFLENAALHPLSVEQINLTSDFISGMVAHQFDRQALEKEPKAEDMLPLQRWLT